MKIFNVQVSNSVQRTIFLGIFLLSSILTWHQMIYYADTIPAFHNDEMPNHQAVTSFFNEGAYESDKFGSAYSAGIAVAWPSHLGWMVGGNLLAARLACAFYSWILFLILGVLFCQRQKIDKIMGLCLMSFLWASMITTPLAFPYWFGFIYNLGELNAAIFIGVALLLILQHPRWAFLLFGIAIWMGKIIYIPAVGIFALSYFICLYKKTTVKRLVGNILINTIYFMLPLVVWGILIYLMNGGEYLDKWIQGQFGWLVFMLPKLFLTGNLTETGGLRSIWTRISSPQLEWVHYSLGTKLKNLFFSFGAIGVAGVSMGIWYRRKKEISFKMICFNYAAVFIILGYAIFYFFFHANMSQRHFQPALYIGIGLIVFWLFYLGEIYTKIIRYFVISSIILILIFQFRVFFKHPLIFIENTYARQCKNLYSYSCDPTMYDKNDSNIRAKPIRGYKFDRSFGARQR